MTECSLNWHGSANGPLPRTSARLRVPASAIPGDHLNGLCPASNDVDGLACRRGQPNSEFVGNVVRRDPVCPPIDQLGLTIRVISSCGAWIDLKRCSLWSRSLEPRAHALNQRRGRRLGKVLAVQRVDAPTNGRHRLNRGGNRQANAALYRAIIVRMRWHPPTIAYVERRTAEGSRSGRSSVA